MSIRWKKKGVVFCLFLFVLVFPSIISSKNIQVYKISLTSAIEILDYDSETEHNRYLPNGNSSVLIALDSNLLGPEKFFTDGNHAIQIFETWVEPFEKRFNINFHIRNITTFTPALNDSLDDSLVKVPEQLSWNLSTYVADPKVNGNGYDWLIIYQEHYGLGRNRVNSIKGNALIIAHNQPLSWTSRQLILLHEIGHLFNAQHDGNGIVDPLWYGSAEYSIMNYTDLLNLRLMGWDKENLPIDDQNFDFINDTKYRFDQNDADGDGLPNYYEFRHNLDPNRNDSLLDFDDDGLSNSGEFIHGTDPKSSDSDADGFSDWAEVYLETAPMNSSDTPIVNNPLIFSSIESVSINIKEPLILKWRALSSNPNYYAIYKNGTLLINNSWSEELIKVSIENKEAGSWNFTCLVADLDGDFARKSIIVHLVKDQGTPLYILDFFFTLIVVSIIQNRKRPFKNTRSRINPLKRKF